MHGDMGVWGWWMMVFMPLMWLGLPALIAWAVWAAGRARGAPAAPLDIVKDRYARGEITREQFEHMKGDLARAGHAGSGRWRDGTRIAGRSS